MQVDKVKEDERGDTWRASRFFKNGVPRPSASTIKAFIDLQGAHEASLPRSEQLGSYAWAANVCCVSTRDVRYWCDPKNKKTVTFSEWFLLKLVGGDPLDTPNPFDVGGTS